MSSILQMFLEALLICCACSMDCLVTGFAYGTDKIKIPFFSALVVNLICSFILGLSLFLGSVIGKFIPHTITVIICATILIIIGLSKIFNSLIKNLIKREHELNKELKFSFLSLNFILTIFAKPQNADIDKSKSLSIGEAAILATALSLDGIAVGLGTGLTTKNTLSYLIVIGVSLITGIIFLLLGRLTGEKIAKKITLNLSWLSGIVLIGLAIIKIIT